MEQQHRTELTTITAFVLEQTEHERLYINLALFEYDYLRSPHYSEKLLLEKLQEDFKRYLIETQKQVKRDPNNYMLRKVNAFFDIHYQQIRRLAVNANNATNH